MNLIGQGHDFAPLKEDSIKDVIENNGVYPTNEKRKWETKEQLKNRVMSVIDKYKEKYDTIIVVAHKMAFQSICNCGDMKTAEISETTF